MLTRSDLLPEVALLVAIDFWISLACLALLFDSKPISVEFSVLLRRLLQHYSFTTTMDLQTQDYYSIILQTDLPFRIQRLRFHHRFVGLWASPSCEA